MTDEPRPASSEARSKVIAVGAAGIASVGYSILVQTQLMPNALPVSRNFLVAAIIGGVLFLLGAIDWHENFKGNIGFWYPSALLSQRMLGALVYLVTGAYIALEAWICYFTGGPLHSPFAVILLTIAVLTPFVTTSSSFKPRLGVLIAVAIAYGWSYYYSSRFEESVLVKQSELSPFWAIATSFVSVVISVFLENRKNSLTRARAKAEGAQPAK